MIVTKRFEGGITVHGITTGTVAVTKEHYRYSGLGVLRIPKILFGRSFVPAMPIWVWVIETPQGTYLIDTGESTKFYDEHHFKEKREGYINRKILRIEVAEEQQINNQLAAIGLSADRIDAVIMTHLHVDHTDGISFFPDKEFFVSRSDWQKPIGAPVSSFPAWFKPSLVEHEKTNLPFSGAYQFSKELTITATPGHTLGHQSVLLEVGEYLIMFAGDTSFDESQLLNNEVGGINLQINKSKETLNNIRLLSQHAQLIYLPSHDPQSGERLANLKITCSEP